MKRMLRNLVVGTSLLFSLGSYAAERAVEQETANTVILPVIVTRNAAGQTEKHVLCEVFSTPEITYCRALRQELPDFTTETLFKIDHQIFNQRYYSSIIHGSIYFDEAKTIHSYVFEARMTPDQWKAFQAEQTNKSRSILPLKSLLENTDSQTLALGVEYKIKVGDQEAPVYGGGCQQ